MDVTPEQLEYADRHAGMIRRRYLMGGGSPSDWETDLSHLVAALQTHVHGEDTVTS